MGGEEEEDDSCGVSSQLPAFYDRQDVSAYLQSVQSKAKASRPTGRFKMRFPGGLEIAVQVGGEGRHNGSVACLRHRLVVLH